MEEKIENIAQEHEDYEIFDLECLDFKTNWFQRLWWSIEYFFHNLFTRIKYFFQRGKRGYDDSDTWDVSMYLAKSIVALVGNMRDNFKSVPIALYENENIPAEKDEDGFFIGYPDESVKLAEEKWRDVLATIVVGFQSYYNGAGCPHDYDEGALKKSFELLEKYFIHLWD